MENANTIEMEEIGIAAKLLQGVEAAMIGELDAVQLQELLARASDSFLHLLEFKVRIRCVDADVLCYRIGVLSSL